SGVPPRVVPGLVASNVHTSARPTPGIVSCGSPAPVTPAIEPSVRCYPRCAHVMKARVPPSANTMSRGSSPISRVCLTRGWRPHLTALELDERRRRAGNGRERDYHEQAGEETCACDHRSSLAGGRTVARVIRDGYILDDAESHPFRETRRVRRQGIVKAKPTT